MSKNISPNTSMYKRLFAALALLSGAASATEPVAFRASTKVEVGIDGKPIKIEAPRDLPDQIRAFIEKTVAAWRFSPPSRDGVSGPGITYVSLGACAFPEGDHYRMAVDFKGNGPGLVGDTERYFLRYPADAQRAGQEANLVVYWVVETDGRATLERIERKGGPRLRQKDSFYQAVQAWVSSLQYEPEQLDGHPVRTRLSGPVTFTLSSKPYHPENEAQEELTRTKQSPECQLAASKLDEGVPAVAIDSPFRLEAL